MELYVIAAKWTIRFWSIQMSLIGDIRNWFLGVNFRFLFKYHPRLQKKREKYLNRHFFPPFKHHYLFLLIAFILLKVIVVGLSNWKYKRDKMVTHEIVVLLYTFIMWKYFSFLFSGLLRTSWKHLFSTKKLLLIFMGTEALPAPSSLQPSAGNLNNSASLLSEYTVVQNKNNQVQISLWAWIYVSIWDICFQNTQGKKIRYLQNRLAGFSNRSTCPFVVF